MVDEKERDYFIAKSNDLVQRTRFNLSVQQQKIILFLISKIKYGDDDFDLYEFSIRDFCAACGINYGGGKAYSNVKAAIKELRDKSFFIQLEDGREALLSWIEKAYISKSSGVVQIRLDSDLKPFLLNLRERYVQYQLADCLAMSSRYAIRLYELLKSYQNIGTATFDIDKFREVVDAGQYAVYANLYARVIRPALEEISSYTDLDIKYTPIKTGRAITSLKFTIKLKADFEDRLLAWHNRDKKLDPESRTLLEDVEEKERCHG